ncbi:Lsr2 family protein [Microbacterium sp. P05]|uniref:histone-like nucleoid-structuring protein Lsr2 n=1 Tax=Microbacterium sp. P05 TaxID=3366948 RepID=UPI003746623C
MTRIPRTIFDITDDLTGETLSSDDAVNIQFTYDGLDYEVDVSRESAKKFEDFLKPYMDARGPKNRSKGRPTSGVDGNARAQNKLIREWAAENGFTVAPRGVIQQEVRDAYHQSH